MASSSNCAAQGGGRGGQADKVPGASQLIAVLKNLDSKENNIPPEFLRKYVYDYHPMELSENYGNGDGPMLFFYKLPKTGTKAKRKIPSSSGQQNGQWKPTKVKSKIRDKNGSVIGTKTCLMYYESIDVSNKKIQNTGWHMNEYRLPENETENEMHEPTLCVMQYGGSKGRKIAESTQQLQHETISIGAELLLQPYSEVDMVDLRPQSPNPMLLSYDVNSVYYYTY
ncbi:hypothetical protein ACH5RR_031624 [Cinchona calisaya]|uniref:NAC domain-containing protein n=1 Tax=Cinchona calisaya TaxID=153742 RepID=A0ABD2YIS9_9GENT